MPVPTRPTAQASGRTTHVNLHTAPGLGNGVGAIFGARANHAPLLVTAGQQVRSLITMHALLANRDAVYSRLAAELSITGYASIAAF